ncbi:MAG: DUF1761 domain-containing protein [Nanoarchaeota archaeon]|nr:DUF1761 domain-containing protein [Nanoarchaeota archaeon]
MLDFTINYLWVFILALVAMAFGALWYSPAFFGRPWMKLSGMADMFAEKTAEMKKKVRKGYALGFLGTLVMFAVLDMMTTSLQAASPREGALLGFFLWLGFVAVVALSKVLWGGESVKLWLIHIANYLVVLVVAGAVLAVV